MFRFTDLTAEEAQWLSERAPIRVVPKFDDPDAPRPLEPIVTPDDVPTTDNALRPRRAGPPNARPETSA
jgi:hypothetical protein